MRKFPPNPIFRSGRYRKAQWGQIGGFAYLYLAQKHPGCRIQCFDCFTGFTLCLLSKLPPRFRHWKASLGLLHQRIVFSYFTSALRSFVGIEKPRLFSGAMLSEYKYKVDLFHRVFIQWIECHFSFLYRRFNASCAIKVL